MHTACGVRVRIAGPDGREYTETYSPKPDLAGGTDIVRSVSLRSA